MSLADLYWICLISGAMLAVVGVLFGDVISHATGGLLDFLSVDYLRPTVLLSAVTAFGGAGILLTEYSGLASVLVATFSIACALAAGAAVYGLYIRPMRNSEVSISFTLDSLAGRIAEVSVPIPAQGCGEVVLKAGVGYTNQIASSFDKTEIPAGTKVVVVEVKDGTLSVSRLNDNND